MSTKYPKAATMTIGVNNRVEGDFSFGIMPAFRFTAQSTLFDSYAI